MSQDQGELKEDLLHLGEHLIGSKAGKYCWAFRGGSHIVNTVGRPGYPPEAGADLVNRCFHCDHPLTGDDLAAEVRRTYLDGLVELGATRAPRRWVAAAVDGAGSFINRGDVPCPAAVPDFQTTEDTAWR